MQQSLFANEKEQHPTVHACGDPDCIVPHPPSHKRPPPTTEERVASRDVSPARRSDPETSHAAAAAWPEIRGEQRIAVYRFLLSCGSAGATDYAIGQALQIQRTSAGKRRKELLELGYVIETDRRAATDTGASAIVWQINPMVLLEPQKARVIE